MHLLTTDLHKIFHTEFVCFQKGREKHTQKNKCVKAAFREDISVVFSRITHSKTKV